MKIKYFLFVLSPLLVKFLADKLLTIKLPFPSFIILSLISIIFMLYWFFVGTQFSNISFMPLIAIITGNLLFIVDAFLFIFIDDTSKGLISIFSKTAFVILFPIVSKIALLITGSETITDTANTIIQYLSILILVGCFVIGYFVNYSSSRKNKYNFSKGLL